MSLLQHVQDLLFVVLPWPRQKGMLQIDPRGLQRLLPVSEMLTRCLVQLAISAHTLRCGEVVARDAEGP